MNNFDQFNSFVSRGNEELQREQSYDWVDAQINARYLQAQEDARVEQEANEAFFALHPQPTLQEARAFMGQELADMTLDEALEALEDEDEEDEGDEEDEDGEDEGNNCCNDVCACIRHFEQEPCPMDIEDEEEDLALYELKRQIASQFVQNKRQKTFDENEVIPMDISDDDQSDDDDDQSDDDNDDNDQSSEFICRHGNNCANQVCLDCVWYLEQEARRAHPRPRPRPRHIELEEGEIDETEGNDYYHEMNFPVLDDNASAAEEPRAQIRYQRQTTSWVDEETGETVYNGSSNGSRTPDSLPDLIDITAEQEEYDNAAEERYNFNMYELEVTYRNGQNVYNKSDADRVAWLRKEIAEYENKKKA
jgi:hypothetical protein